MCFSLRALYNHRYELCCQIEHSARLGWNPMRGASYIWEHDLYISGVAHPMIHLLTEQIGANCDLWCTPISPLVQWHSSGHHLGKVHIFWVLCALEQSLVPLISGLLHCKVLFLSTWDISWTWMGSKELKFCCNRMSLVFCWWPARVFVVVVSAQYVVHWPILSVTSHWAANLLMRTYEVGRTINASGNGMWSITSYL